MRVSTDQLKLFLTLLGSADSGDGVHRGVRLSAACEVLDLDKDSIVRIIEFIACRRIHSEMLSREKAREEFNKNGGKPWFFEVIGMNLWVTSPDDRGDERTSIYLPEIVEVKDDETGKEVEKLSWAKLSGAGRDATSLGGVVGGSSGDEAGKADASTWLFLEFFVSKMCLSSDGESEQDRSSLCPDGCWLLIAPRHQSLPLELKKGCSPYDVRSIPCYGRTLPTSWEYKLVEDAKKTLCDSPRRFMFSLTRGSSKLAEGVPVSLSLRTSENRRFLILTTSPEVTNCIQDETSTTVRRCEIVLEGGCRTVLYGVDLAAVEKWWKSEWKEVDSLDVSVQGDFWDFPSGKDDFVDGVEIEFSEVVREDGSEGNIYYKMRSLDESLRRGEAIVAYDSQNNEHRFSSDGKLLGKNGEPCQGRVSRYVYRARRVYGVKELQRYILARGSNAKVVAPEELKKWHISSCIRRIIKFSDNPQFIGNTQ